MQQRYYRAARTNNTASHAQEGEQPTPPQSEFESPALLLGKRIKKEQGRERAYEFLGAMEPFLARGERELIASQLGVALPEYGTYTRDKREAPRQSPANGSSTGTDNMASLLKLFQLMNGVPGGSAGAQKGGSTGGIDPSMLAKLMGMMK